MNGKIKIENYKVHCVIGAKKEEREKEQEIAFDIEIEADFSKAIHSDSLSATIDYEKIGHLISQLAKTKRYHLLETFASEALSELFSFFPIQYGKITVKKKSALPLANFVAVIFEKSKND